MALALALATATATAMAIGSPQSPVVINVLPPAPLKVVGCSSLRGGRGKLGTLKS